jgi:hypothetical protein
MIFPEFLAEELARNFVIVVLTILVLLSTFLVFTAVILRKMHSRNEEYRLRKKEELYPLVLSYLDLDPGSGPESEAEVKAIENEIRKKLQNRRDLEVIEDLSIEIMFNISGMEKLRLRRLLLIDPLYNHRFRQLGSRRVENLIQACLYFTNVINQCPAVLDKIFPLLAHKSILVLHTAASAIFSFENVQVRGRALRNVCYRTGISEMALLELVYKFHNKEQDQMDQEVDELINIISDSSIPELNRGIIIKSVADIGYATMADYLYDLVPNVDDSRDRIISESLIHAMGRFEYSGSAELLAKKFTASEYINIRENLADTLGKLGNSASIPALVKLTSDEDFGVRVRAVYALAAMGETGHEALKLLKSNEGEIQRLAENIIEQLESGKVGEH